MPRKSAESLSVVAGTIEGRPSFSVRVWQRTVASEASTFFKTAALQVARQRAISLSATTLAATCSAPVLGTPTAPPGGI
jgi:hypothetical protein